MLFCPPSIRLTVSSSNRASASRLWKGTAPHLHLRDLIRSFPVVPHQEDLLGKKIIPTDMFRRRGDIPHLGKIGDLPRTRRRRTNHIAPAIDLHHPNQERRENSLISPLRSISI